jgi:BirA family biotin operon repressor/biotin-[acetyl-CoA-carboxylase] ligase
MICRESILQQMQHQIPVFSFDTVDSTNEAARRFLLEHDCQQAVFVANAQTAGKGRLGRSFYSPADTGLYMTYVFRTDALTRETLRITTAASVAVAQALDCGARIKWVNDLYLQGKKICGILTETVVTRHTYVLIGIGINLTTALFPEDLQHKAGAVGRALSREALVANLCDRLAQAVDSLAAPTYLDYYRQHMLGLGQEITYIEDGVAHSARMTGITDWGELIVLEDGRERLLCSGEISLRIPGAALL